MTLYALDAIDDAIDVTRAFLWPFDRRRWTRLALVMLFVGGAGGFNPLQFSGGGGTGGGTDIPGGPGGPGGPAGPDVVPTLGGPELAVVAVIAGLVALLALGFVFVGSVMEFVFVESLRRETVTIRRYWRERWRQGLRLFGFRIVLGLVSLGIIGGLMIAILAPVVFGHAAFSLGLLLVALPVIVVVSILSGLLNGFTTMFVVPVMIGEERNVLSAWRRFWPTLTGQWKQYAVYAIMGFVLQLAGGILTGIASLIGIVVIAIPLGIVGLVGAGLLTVVDVVGGVVIAIAVLLFVLAAIALVLFVSVPVQTFLRYYALLVLGETNAAFDLIPEQRQMTRER
jgi:hypothetical protein